jgi:hypothetical protein
MKNIKLKENVKGSPSPEPKHNITNNQTTSHVQLNNSNNQPLMTQNTTQSNFLNSNQINSGVNKIPISGLNKGVVSKGLNIIPIKNIQSHREGMGGIATNNYFNNDRIPDNRFSPKPRDIKIASNYLSPNQGQKSKLIPISTKPAITSNVAHNQIGFETNKISNKILTNIINNINNKSPSPKHFDSTKTNVVNSLTKKSPR